MVLRALARQGRSSTSVAASRGRKSSVRSLTSGVKSRTRAQQRSRTKSRATSSQVTKPKSRAASSRLGKALRKKARSHARSKAGSKSRHSKGHGDDDGDEDEDEETDDEDSDDEQREILEERLREEDRLETIAPRKLDKKAKQAPHLVTTAKKVPYQIAIPTFERWRPVKDMTNKKRFKNCKTPFILMHTLGFLSRQKIPKGNVTLFVASKAEVQNYKAALKGSDWENVNIVVSVLGNKNSRNFIYKYYKAGTYVVSIDDDVERISWKFREGITHHVLGVLPAVSFEKLIFDGYERMKDKKACLWGLNTSQNPRHMHSHGVSIRNGLVNGYLNGFICRPNCSAELLRTLTDATEDSEFAVRHYAKDGVVLRYRMYAGITSPYLNRGGLQTKFESKGERITAEQRSAARKSEERWGAEQLHHMFPRLVGKPRQRRDAKTMEVVFYPHGYPFGEGTKRRMIAPRLRDDDQINYVPNPKHVGSHSFKLYERYSKAKTVGEAKRLGARGIDLAFDSNWGYLTVSKLSVALQGEKSESCQISEESRASKASAKVAHGDSKTVKVRVLEMSEGHNGLDVPRCQLSQLAARCPALRSIKEEQWAAKDGPFAKVALDILRILLQWASSGRLRYERRHTKAVYKALLKCCDSKAVARRVKELEAQENATARKTRPKVTIRKGKGKSLLKRKFAAKRKQ